MRSLSASIRFLLSLAPDRLRQSGAAGHRLRTLPTDHRARWRGLSLTQRVEQSFGRGAVQILVEIVVDLQDRGIDARAETLDLDQSEKPVGCGAAHAYTELALA